MTWWSNASIRQRLILQLAGIAALLAVAFFLSIRVVAERAATDTQDNILAASASAIADAVYSERGAVRLELPYSALSMLGTISDDRVFYRVLVDGETLTGYEDLPLPQGDAPRGRAAFETALYKGDQVRLALLQRFLGAGSELRKVQVVVGQTRLGMEVVSSRVTNMATAIGAVFFVVATTLSVLAANSALAPIERLTASVGRRGPNDLRPVTGPTPRELQPLVGALNGFMERLRAALSRSEDLIAEAAHRVRTPLATVRTQAEVIHRNMRRDENRAAVREMIRAVDESSRSAGQLLEHAMVTFRSDQIEPEPFDIGAIVADTIHRLTPTAELRDIELRFDPPAGQLEARGDAILVQSALRNILDNAIKYSPEETDIRIEIDGKNPCGIHVIDQGRGFPAEGRARITDRFSRGTNVGDIVGSGLGLTIARDVARAHGGKLTISDNPKGQGACVSLYLPLG